MVHTDELQVVHRTNKVLIDELQAVHRPDEEHSKKAKFCFIRGKYQILDYIHTRLLAVGEWCCTPNSPAFGIYDAYMLGGLRLPLNAFAREI